MKRYEGMFLFDSAAGREWPVIDEEVRRLFDRIGAQAQVVCKFDERRLAYEIDKRKRGTYVLTIFDADPTRIGDLERDARLSESILRLLVTRPEGLTDEKLAELKAHPVDQPLTPHVEQRRDDDAGGPPRRGRDGDRRDFRGGDGYRDREERNDDGEGRGGRGDGPARGERNYDGDDD